MPQTFTIRDADAGDRPQLDRLAALDSSVVPPGSLLIGELDGRPAAALSLSDGAVIADPFLPTAELLTLMRGRARQCARARRATRLLRLRLALR
jgi:hypothetical protein